MEKLSDLFGPAERWGQTLRNRFWTNATVNIGAFTGGTSVQLQVPCTYDLNVASAKYFYALEEGEVSLLFLFSGSLFYRMPDGRLRIERVSWEKECLYQMHIRTWREMMEQHYPKSTWLPLSREVFDRLYAVRREKGLASWEEVIGQLLEKKDGGPSFRRVAQASSPASASGVPPAVALGSGGGTPPELAGEDACATREEVTERLLQKGDGGPSFRWVNGQRRERDRAVATGIAKTIEVRYPSQNAEEVS
jgi:hypothetical protein